MQMLKTFLKLIKVKQDISPVTVPGEPKRTLMETVGAVANGSIAPVINNSNAWFGGFTLVPGTTSSKEEMSWLITMTMRAFYSWYYCPPEIAIRFLPGNSDGPPLPKTLEEALMNVQAPEPEEEEQPVEKVA